MTRLPVLFALSLTVAAAACTSTPGAAAPAPAPKHSSNLITHDQIVARQWSNAYDLIHELHPTWLTLRGRTTLYGPDEDVHVHVDGARVGGMASLRDISLQGVEYIEYFPPNEAAARWGTGYANGAIIVSTHPREP